MRVLLNGVGCEITVILSARRADTGTENFLATDKNNGFKL